MFEVGAAQVPEEATETLAQRDFVKHWYHADNDAQQDGLIAALQLTEMAPQR